MNARRTALGLALSFAAFATPSFAADRDTVSVRGVKFPNDASEGDQPFVDRASAPRRDPNSGGGRDDDSAPLTGFTTLVPYAMRSPNQEDAGSCLYMSLTGMAEWWLARLNPTVSREPDGPLDLSERYFMNLAGRDEYSAPLKNWKTDSIQVYNEAGGSVRNRVYPFTKGYSKVGPDGLRMIAVATDPDADYSTLYNWIDDTRQVTTGWVRLPTFTRRVIYADPASNQWNVGVMPSNIVESVKSALYYNGTPVQVIYNHMGYWHAVDIVGFDSYRSSENCDFVERFRTYMKTQPASLRVEAENKTDPTGKAALLARAEKFRSTSAKVEAAYAAGGGCHPTGMFYVRDSIYADDAGPVYHYDPAHPEADSPYGKAIILREYDWLRYIANHAIAISAHY